MYCFMKNRSNSPETIPDTVLLNKKLELTQDLITSSMLNCGIPSSGPFCILSESMWVDKGVFANTK